MTAAARRVLAVVPARGGSKGVPGKNLAEVGGASLLAHAVLFARSVPEVSRCVVSTDDDAIAAAAVRFGTDVVLRRPAGLAADDTPMAPVVRHALETVEAADGRYDRVVLLMPTTPMRSAADVSSAVGLLDSVDADGVISVSEPPYHPSFVGVRSAPDGSVIRYFEAGTGLTRRQDAGRFLRVTGQFYVWRAEFVRRLERSWLDEGRHLSIETDDFTAVDVDSPADLDRLRRLVAAGVLKLDGAPSQS